MKFVGISGPQWSLAERKFPPMESDWNTRFYQENNPGMMSLKGLDRFRFFNKNGF